MRLLQSLRKISVFLFHSVSTLEEREFNDLPSDQCSTADPNATHLLPQRENAIFEINQQKSDNSGFSSMSRCPIQTTGTCLTRRPKGDVLTSGFIIPPHPRNPETDITAVGSSPESPLAVHELGEIEPALPDAPQRSTSFVHSSTTPTSSMDRGQHNATFFCIDRLCNSHGIFYIVLTSCSVFLACLTSVSPVCLVLFVAIASFVSFHLCSWSPRASPTLDFVCCMWWIVWSKEKSIL